MLSVNHHCSLAGLKVNHHCSLARPKVNHHCSLAGPKVNHPVMDSACYCFHYCMLLQVPRPQYLSCH